MIDKCIKFCANWKYAVSIMILATVPCTISHAIETDQNPQKKATKSWRYGFVTEYQCLQTPSQFAPAQGFDPLPPHALLTDAELIKVVGHGVMTFFNNGKVTVSEVVGSQLSTAQNYPGAVPLAPAIGGDCNDGSYQIHDNNRITVVFPSCGVQRPGFSAIGGPLELDGLYANNFRWIKLALTNGSIQTMHISVEGYPDQEIQRGCLQTFVLDRM